jgi:hypothetical protein
VDHRAVEPRRRSLTAVSGEWARSVVSSWSKIASARARSPRSARRCFRDSPSGDRPARLPWRSNSLDTFANVRLGALEVAAQASDDAEVRGASPRSLDLLARRKSRQRTEPGRFRPREESGGCGLEIGRAAARCASCASAQEVTSVRARALDRARR